MGELLRVHGERIAVELDAQRRRFGQLPQAAIEAARRAPPEQPASGPPHQHHVDAHHRRGRAQLGAGQLGGAPLAPRHAEVGERAGQAPRIGWSTKHRAQVHEPLVEVAGRLAGDGFLGQPPQLGLRLAGHAVDARQDAPHVAVDDGQPQAEGDRADGARRVAPHAWELQDLLEGAREAAGVAGGDVARRRVQVARPRVVTEPGPQREDVVEGRLGQRIHRRKARHPAVPVGGHGLEPRLLRHHLADPDGVGVARLAPRQGSPVTAIESQDALGEIGHAARIMAWEDSLRRWLCALLLAACGDEPKPLPVGESCELTQTLPMGISAKLDLLFVIDTSAGMRDRQAMLIENLPRLMDVVTTSERPLDLQLGVISADLAQDGALLAAPRLPGCAAPDGTFLRWKNKLRGGFDANFSGALRDAFPCIATLTTDGGEPRPLAALQRALENPANAGFVRPDAYLGVVIVSSRDDASAADWLRAVKPNPNLVIVSAVVPPDATALRALPDGNGAIVSLLASDITDALAPYFHYLQILVGAPCLWSGVDTNDFDASEPGLQLACNVELGRFQSPSTTLPRCRMDSSETPHLDALPCWWVRPQPILCAHESGLELVVELADWPDPGTSATSHCATVCE